MNDYRTYSYWLESVEDDLTPRPPLTAGVSADVAILGAGYSGLWTAYYLNRLQPALDIKIVEAEVAGFGASGRNGSWCSSGFPVSPGQLVKRFGRDTARQLEETMFRTVDEVGEVCRQENIDAHFNKSGVLRIARGRHQVPALHAAYAAYRDLGLADHFTLLDAAQTEQRVKVTEAQGSLFNPDCATVHPAALVRGLARVVERHGVTIYEGSPVVDVPSVPTPRLVTEGGEIRAGVVVLCGEAYLSRLRAFHRKIMPLYSLIALTEPLSAEQWERIGWAGRECLSSFRYTVDYLARTRDGRILFGSRGAPYHYDSRIDDAYDRHDRTHRMIQSLFYAWFPGLRDVSFTHHWGGPVGMPRDWMPTVAFDPATGIATARGYTGQGVATTNLAGRTLAHLITGVPSELTSLPFVNHRSPDWEPEPLRWLGMRFLQREYERIDLKAERTGKPPSGRSPAEILGKH
ncbi:MAG TPA: FAD-binding oxidoreductase [Chloroflexota bacterium]|nr:FAD-binding oxidoreductase [Chloroflexota bacterium]